MGDRATIPATAIAVERSIPIIVTPIAADHEADNRDADLCAICRHQYALILVVVLQIIAGDPAAIAKGDDIAPFPSIRAPLDGYLSADRDCGDSRIAAIRSRTQIDIGRNKAIRGMCEQRGEKKQ